MVIAVIISRLLRATVEFSSWPVIRVIVNRTISLLGVSSCELETALFVYDGLSVASENRLLN